ncbi:hypothetical protein [Cryobacterium sp. Hz9]|uniref:hypothetical protein n=1 Tax=Cryobacterium sp. Hz9 TaxID=1259167 RepID=UPI0010693ED9|nr:hypothetical protein [Cryobacterium sp. Hz9]TFB66161.1 hypothetical protein E3N85_09965 [Cryobacterium sp. Hz9]
MANIEGMSALPRSVLVADDRLYRAISQNPDSVTLLEDLDAMVIPYSGRAEVNEQQSASIREVLLAAGQLISGALLIRNPYETASYEFAEYAIESFASAKYHALANVARLLGAREIHVVDAKVAHTVAKSGAGVKAKIPAGGAEAEISKEVSKKLEERLEGHMKFPGAEPAPEDALVYLRRRNLSNDQQLRDLVEMRTGANPISHYKVTLSGTRESAANLRSALKIANAGPVKAVDIGASFSKTAESISSIEITIEIAF